MSRFFYFLLFCFCALPVAAYSAEERRNGYEITVDKREISATIEDLPFSIGELLSASDVLAWILNISPKTHKKNKKGIKKL